MRVYLIRHGQTVAGPAYSAQLRQPNPELDDTGVRQAELLGQRLQGFGIGAIFSSDLKRAAETAERIHRYTNCPITFRPQLREIDMGDVFLNGWQAYPEFYLQWQKHEADLPYPRGEAGIDVQKRAWPVLAEIVRLHSCDVAVVTHGGVIMVLISACLGLAQYRRFNFSSPANCSISTLVHNSQDGLWRIGQFNDTAHLEDLSQPLPGG